MNIYIYRVSDGLVAMFKQPVNNTIPLALFDIQNGERLVKWKIYKSASVFVLYKINK